MVDLVCWWLGGWVGGRNDASPRLAFINLCLSLLH